MWPRQFVFATTILANWPFNDAGVNAAATGKTSDNGILELARASLEQRTRSVDQIISDAAARHLTPLLPIPFTVCAVGGYGRSELFPHSDIDLLILADNEDESALNEGAVERFLAGGVGCRPARQSIGSAAGRMLPIA